MSQLKPPAPRRLVSGLLSGFVLLVLAVAAIIISGALSRPELRWLDWQMQSLAGNVSDDATDPVVVVGIDEASLQEFGVPVATLHRQIGAFFEAMALARPRAVGVDVVLPQASFDRIQPGLDAALARGILALRPVAPLVLGMSAAADGTLRPLHPLFANLAGNEGVAMVFIVKDEDGVMRRLDERIGDRQQSLPTLAGRIAQRIGEPVQAGLIPFFRGQRFSYVSLKDVLAWRTAGDQQRLAETFAGKIVFLGSLLPYDDQHLVPVPLAQSDAGDTTHGVFIHAAQMRAMLADGPIREIPSGWTLLAALCLALSWWLRPGLRAWLVTVATTAALLALSPRLLSAGTAIPALTWSFALLAGIASRTTLEAWLTAAERRRLRLAFDGFVSPGVLTEILAGRLNPTLAGERRDVCVLFSDIRSFTTMSEHMSPETVTDLLNRYFERMAACIHRHGGTLDKFIGDGIMAFFGAPQANADACSEAFAAAQEMIDELAAFNQEQQASGGPVVAIGVGLHYGPALIGYIGAKARHEYSAIGDTVNTASRLEGLTKDAGYPIVVSPAVRERLPDIDGLVDLGEHKIKGRAPVRIFGWNNTKDKET
jgi:class 3 adenylate cyclase/CHASE2 domain-containing sensor protein